MTDDELNEIEKRANAAAPGPWEDAEASVWEHGQRVVDEVFVRRPGDNIAVAIAVASQILNPCADPRNVPSQDTAAFIAHAREDVPALIAEVRRLKARNAELEGGFREISRIFDEMRWSESSPRCAPFSIVCRAASVRRSPRTRT
jgi:hypothetical protein